MSTMKRRLGLEWRDFLDDLHENLNIVFVIATGAFLVGCIFKDFETGALWGGGVLLYGFITVPLIWARYDRDHEERHGFKTTALVLLIAMLASGALLALLLLPLLLID